MKTLLCCFIFFSSIFSIHAQNGIYQSSRFEYINEANPSKNRVEFSNKTLVIQINELQGEFRSGKILWEMNNNGQSEYIEWELTALKNSYFDEKTSAFIKCYKANMKVLNVVIRPVEIFISKFTKENTYRIDVYDPELKVINRFDNLNKK